MSCKYRFHKELLPKPGMRFLFIGTFNPIWDLKHGDNPDYFYSRDKSEFWCILPHAFNQNCLVDKNRIDKEEFCNVNKIGLTDLIYSIDNVQENDEKHKTFLTKGFKDEDFESDEYLLDIDFFTSQIEKYIDQNKRTLKGVFFTRKTKKGIPRLWTEWVSIRKTCQQNGVYCSELPSPSPRGGGIRSKIVAWRTEIHVATNK